MRRLLLLLLLGPLLLLTAAGPAAADDLYEIDLRLDEAGFTDAYTQAYDAASGDGFRMSVDYVSDSTSRAAYESEARALSEVLWDHLEGRLLAVDVVPTSEVPWTPDGLPPAVSFVRADLQAAFGDRPTGLDDGSVYGDEAADELPLDDLGLGLDPAVVVLIGLGMVLVAGLVVLVVVLLVRRQPAAPPAWGGWPGPAAWPQPGAPGWQPAAAPPAAPPTAGPVAPAPGTGDPWSPPPGR